LYQKRQDFELVLVGDGIDFEMIKSYAHELKLEDKVVTFTGVLTGKALVEEYQKSNFSVLFSNYENIPVVISESFACGKPSEHINASNGLLIDAGDEKALLSSLEYMLDNYKQYNTSEIKEIAKQKYSFNSVGKTLASIYKNILSA
jgi:glycosyltransferase involved in cell wall biosynthesis